MSDINGPKGPELPPELIEINEGLAKKIVTLLSFIQQQNLPVDQYLAYVKQGMAEDNDDDPSVFEALDAFSEFALYSPEQVLDSLNHKAAFEPAHWLTLKALIDQFWLTSEMHFEPAAAEPVKPSVIVQVTDETAESVMNDLNLQSGRKGGFRGKA